MDSPDPTDRQARQETVRSCIICNSGTRRALFKHGYWIVECVQCGHRSTEVVPALEHVAQVYGDDYFEGGGAGYTNYLEEAELLQERGRRYGELLKRFTPPGSVLDVGAAAGFILSGLRDAGWQGVGVEPNGKMAAYGARSLGLDLRQGVLETFEENRTFDVVTMIQVLAHFFDPHAALERAAALTRPHGFWLIETWDRDSWTARLLGQYWHEYSPPSVLHWYSRRGLVELANRYGFELEDEGRPSKWLTGKHARSLLEHSVQGSFLRPVVKVAASAIPLKAKLPYPAEDLRWMLFRRA